MDAEITGVGLWAFPAIFLRHAGLQNRMAFDTRRPSFQFGIVLGQSGFPHRRLAAASMPTSAMVAALSWRSRYWRSHSVEQQRRPLLSNSLPQPAQVMMNPVRPSGSVYQSGLFLLA
jgi:hypothetical protein